MRPIMLERLSVVAAPGSYQITPRLHTATFYSTVSSRSLGAGDFWPGDAVSSAQPSFE